MKKKRQREAAGVGGIYGEEGDGGKERKLPPDLGLGERDHPRGKKLLPSHRRVRV